MSRAAYSVRRFAGTAYPVVFEDAGPVMEQLARIMPSWPSECGDRREGEYISVHRDTDGFCVRSPWLDEPHNALSDVGAACSLIVDIARSYTLADPSLLCFHCSAVEIGGKIVLFTGPARTGKTLLAAHLAATGARLVCDDILPVTAMHEGVGLGVAPRLRLPLPDNASPDFASFVRGRAGPSDGYYMYVDPPGLLPHGHRLPLGAVVLLDRRDDGPAFLSTAGRAEALKHLIRQNLARDSGASDVMARVETLMERLLCLRMTYASAEDAAKLLSGTFDDFEAAKSVAWPAAPPLDLANEAHAADGFRQICTRSRYRHREGIRLKTVEGEYFLASPEDDAILHLNATGAALWRLLARETSPAEAADILREAFPDADAAVIDRDVAAVFAELLAYGLIDLAARTR